MIVFSGAITAKNELKIEEVRKTFMLKVFSIFLAIWAILGFVCVHFGIGDIKEILAYIILALVIITIILIIPIQKHRYNYIYHITIDNEEIVCVDNVFKKTRRKKLKQIRKVIDAGECYYVIYKWGDIGNCIICQKDLIREGTIEEFEELFKGKIVKEKEKKVFKRKNK